MLIEELYDNIFDFISSATGLPDQAIAQEMQIAQRPSKPYLTFNLGSFKHESQPIIRDLDANGLSTIVTPVISIAVFKSYSDTTHGAESILYDLYRAFNTELQNTIWKGNIALHRTIKNVTSIPYLASQVESRAILEVELSFNLDRIDNVGLIEHVHITDDITNQEYIINK